MKVLITGHRGLAGSHLWRECVQRYQQIVGVDIAPGGPPMPGADLGSISSGLGAGLDITSMDCRKFFARNTDRFDLVFHCAATVGGRETIDGNPLAVATNLSLDAEMFNWAMRTRPGRVVYFSSSAAYPVHMQQLAKWERELLGVGASEVVHLDPLAESAINHGSSHIGRPDQTYGLAKLVGEILAQQVNDAGIPVHVTRAFSGYGTDQTPDYPFRAFLDRARRREDPFVIWGDGQQTRDFIHIDDIVGAVFAAIEQDVRGPVNLCTGIGTSFTELATMVTKAAGYSPKFEYLTDKPVGVQYRVGDPSLMRTFYEPKVSLEQGIRMALDSAVMPA